MKVTATVTKVDADKAEAKGVDYHPEKPYTASWLSPSGMRIFGYPGRTKADALENLAIQVRVWLATTTFASVDEGEVDV